jgi:hypothetical protein
MGKGYGSSLNTMPPPSKVVPYRLPSESRITPLGETPSGQLAEHSEGTITLKLNNKATRVSSDHRVLNILQVEHHQSKVVDDL